MKLYLKNGVVRDFNRREFKDYLITQGQILHRSKLPKRCKERDDRDFYVRYNVIYAVTD
jgi:hypothetical protein